MSKTNRTRPPVNKNTQKRTNASKRLDLIPELDDQPAKVPTLANNANSANNANNIEDVDVLPEEQQDTQQDTQAIKTNTPRKRTRTQTRSQTQDQTPEQAKVQANVQAKVQSNVQTNVQANVQTNVPTKVQTKAQTKAQPRTKAQPITQNLNQTPNADRNQALPQTRTRIKNRSQTDISEPIQHPTPIPIMNKNPIQNTLQPSPLSKVNKNSIQNPSLITSPKITQMIQKPFVISRERGKMEDSDVDIDTDNKLGETPEKYDSSDADQELSDSDIDGGEVELNEDDGGDIVEGLDVGDEEVLENVEGSDDEEEYDYDELGEGTLDTEVDVNTEADTEAEGDTELDTCLYGDVDVYDTETEETLVKERVFVDPDERVSKPMLYNYEKIRILCDRIAQLEAGAKPMLKNGLDMSYKDMALKEIKEGVIPLIIIRELPNGTFEKWYVRELSR